MLVHGNSAPLKQGAGFALGSRKPRVGGQQFNHGDPVGQGVAGGGELGDVLEHVQQSGFVQAAQGVRGGVAKQDFGGFLGPTQGVGAVNAGRDFFGQKFLQGALVRGLRVRRLHRFNFLARGRAENAHVLGHVGICGVQPKLIKLVRGGAFGVQPNVSGFGLAELGAVGLFDQRCG